MADWFAQRGADLLLEHIESAVCAGRSEGAEGAGEGGVCGCGGELSERGLCDWGRVGGCAVLDLRLRAREGSGSGRDSVL